MPDILVIEASPVKLGNGNSVTLENGNVVVAPPSVSVSENIAIQIETVGSDLSVNVSDSISTTESELASVSEPEIGISDSVSTSDTGNVTVYGDLADLEIYITEARLVILENGNRVVLENGDRVVLSPAGVIVSENVFLATGDLQTAVSSSLSISESISVGEPATPTARVYGPAIQTMG